MRKAEISLPVVFAFIQILFLALHKHFKLWKMKLYFQKFSSLAHVFYTSATNTFFSFIHAGICFITRSFFIIFITEFSYSLHSFSGFFRIIFNIYEIINISYFIWYCLCKKCYIYLHFYSLEKKIRLTSIYTPLNLLKQFLLW